VLGLEPCGEGVTFALELVERVRVGELQVAARAVELERAALLALAPLDLAHGLADRLLNLAVVQREVKDQVGILVLQADPGERETRGELQVRHGPILLERPVVREALYPRRRRP